MAEQIMTVRPVTKSGVLDLAADTYQKLGNAGGGSDFLIPNDGKTVLMVDGVTGDTFTFVAVADKYGRTETLAVVVASGKWAMTGPFNPSLWNDAGGYVHFKPTAGNVGDILLAVRVDNPS